MSERMHFSQENVPYFIIEFDENTQTLKITKLSYVIWAPEHRNHTKSAKSGAAESRFLLPPKGCFFKVSICPSRVGLFTLQNPLERSAFILLPLHQISSDIGAFEMVLFSKAFKSTPYQRYWQEYHNVQ